MPLHAYYDARLGPVTFDFAYFLVNAECCRQATKQDSIDLHIISPAFRKITPRDIEYDDPEKKWRLNHIVGQLPRLLPTISRVNLQYREITEISLPNYPPGYPFDMGVQRYSKYYTPISFKGLHAQGKDVQPFRASEHAKQLVRNYTRGHSYITVSLRTTQFQDSRNSNIGAWYRFNQLARENGKRVLVIPDFEDYFYDRAAWKYDWEIVDFASHDLDLRLALYEDADDNFTVNNGIAALLFFSKCPVKMFNVTVPDINTTSAEYLKWHWEVEVGESPTFLNANQAWVWKDDSIETLSHYV